MDFQSTCPTNVFTREVYDKKCLFSEAHCCFSLNRWCAPYMRYVLCESEWDKICNCTSIFHMYNCVCDKMLHVMNANPYFYDLDSTVQTDFPKKRRSESGMAVRNTWIQQCHICYQNVAYAWHVFGILVLSRDYAVCAIRITQNIGKRVNVRFYMCDCVCDKTDSWIQNFTTQSQNSGFNQPIRVSRQVRRVTETHGYCNITYRCSICGISALGTADTHRQLCIAD